MVTIYSMVTMKDKNIKFPFETEKDNSFSFLGVTICREKDKFTTGVFGKDTFSGVYTNFSSFVALEHKFGFYIEVTHFYIEVLLMCLIFRNFILKLKHLRKHFTKMLISLNLLTNV